jgi:FtsZ-binding cell division protein ZapB
MALKDAEFRASAGHTRELRMGIDQMREQNAILREKATAYQQKIEKINNEADIVRFDQDRRQTHEVINEVEIWQAETDNEIGRLSTRMGEEAERYDQMVTDLSEIIEGMKAKIQQRLQEMNGGEEIGDEGVP